MEWDASPLLHPNAVGIAVKKGFIAQGAERATFEMTEIASNRQPVGQLFVGKFSLYEEPSQLEFHKLCAFNPIRGRSIGEEVQRKVERITNADWTFRPSYRVHPSMVLRVAQC